MFLPLNLFPAVIISYRIIDILLEMDPKILRQKFYRILLDGVNRKHVYRIRINLWLGTKDNPSRSRADMLPIAVVRRNLVFWNGFFIHVASQSVRFWTGFPQPVNSFASSFPSSCLHQGSIIIMFEDPLGVVCSLHIREIKTFVLTFYIKPVSSVVCSLIMKPTFP